MTVTVLAEDLLPEGAGQEVSVSARTVGEAAEAAGLVRRTGLVILVNGRLADWSMQLAEGDVIEFMPALGGG